MKLHIFLFLPFNGRTKSVFLVHSWLHHTFLDNYHCIVYHYLNFDLAIVRFAFKTEEKKSLRKIRIFLCKTQKLNEIRRRHSTTHKMHKMLFFFGYFLTPSDFNRKKKTEKTTSTRRRHEKSSKEAKMKKDNSVSSTDQMFRAANAWVLVVSRACDQRKQTESSRSNSKSSPHSKSHIFVILRMCSCVRVCVCWPMFEWETLLLFWTKFVWQSLAPIRLCAQLSNCHFRFVSDRSWQKLFALILRFLILHIFTFVDEKRIQQVVFASSSRCKLNVIDSKWWSKWWQVENRNLFPKWQANQMPCQMPSRPQQSIVDSIKTVKCAKRMIASSPSLCSSCCRRHSPDSHSFAFDLFVSVVFLRLFLLF